MAARKRNAPDWKTDLRRVERSYRDVLAIIDNHSMAIRQLQETIFKLLGLASRAGVHLPSPDTHAVDGRKDGDNQELVPTGGPAEDLKPSEDVVSDVGNEAPDQGNTQNN